MKTGHSHQRSSKNELINDLFAFQLGSVANIFHKPRRLITLSRDTRYDKYKSLFIQKFKSIMPRTFVASLYPNTVIAFNIFLFKKFKKKMLHFVYKMTEYLNYFKI